MEMAISLVVISQDRPVNGDLWFDTRQGRLMVYVDDAYYQTNGADVLTSVSIAQPSTEVVGALWYNPNTGSLFVFDGAVWNNITSSAFSTTNLPLSTITVAKSGNTNDDLTVASKYQPGTEYTQSTLNQWIIKAIGELDQQSESNRLDSNIRETFLQVEEPAEARTGNVWYDLGNQELKIYKNSEWIKAVNLVPINAEILAIKNCHDQCEQNTNQKFIEIEQNIEDLPFESYATVESVSDQVNAVSVSVNSLTNNVGDLNRFQLKATASIEHAAIEHRISILENTPGPDLTGYSTADEIQIELNTLEQKIVGYNYATQAYVSDKIAEIEIPNVANKLDSSIHTAYVTQADAEFLKKGGGRITGALTLDYTAIDSPTLDFSSSFASGVKALAIQAKNAANPVYFGTSSNPNELLWEFQGSENFIWKHKNTSVFSVNKDGASVKALTVNGIDVEAKLAQLQSQTSTSNTGGSASHDHSEIEEAISQLQTQLNEGLCANQIYYQDAAPTNVHDGDIWFNSQTLTLYVRHSNAWINPDRVTDETVEGTADLDEVTNDISELQAQFQTLSTSVAALNGNDLNLKADLFNAVRGSTNFTDLKSRLMSALSS